MHLDIYKCIGEIEMISYSKEYDIQPGDSLLIPYKTNVWQSTDHGGTFTISGLGAMESGIKELMRKIDGIKITFPIQPPLSIPERIKKAVQILLTGEML